MGGSKTWQVRLPRTSRALAAPYNGLRKTLRLSHERGLASGKQGHERKKEEEKKKKNTRYIYIYICIKLYCTKHARPGPAPPFSSLTSVDSPLGACLVRLAGLRLHHLRVEIDIRQAISKYVLGQPPNESESDDKPGQECKGVRHRAFRITPWLRLMLKMVSATAGLCSS